MNDSSEGKFEELINIVKRLKAPDGCPWDREQTNASLLPFFLEEVYEVIESVDNENWLRCFRWMWSWTRICISSFYIN